ncbi:sporulation phosphorelay system protein KapB [Macrococcoides bohemicum]|uniref:sporulation phosphorelay system protein KapB n=1 Tax=Macrococcoides bohemicum TaxID=1903056 RepID=UPI00165D4EF9|nr:sporulation phosphorelay system protein KapB [Macrococcus bohemicus]MBC9874607.1 kinase [Macrococcus bohemicus]QYA45514.1 kinase-associated lipoprotein B [Macrococcus bohemicus]
MYFRLMHKTGIYIVEKVQDHPNGVLVSIESVITHPMQGDLHNRGEVENVFFHERKALSYKEKRVVDENLLKPYTDAVLPYVESLIQAVSKMEQKLKNEDTLFNRKALDTLSNIKYDYERQYKFSFPE